MKNVLTGFKDFILRGSVLDLAIGIVIGGAFAALVDSLVHNFISPLIAMFFGKPDFSSALILVINKAEFRFGAILTEIVNFVAIGAAIYFVVVLPMNKLQERRKAGLEITSEDPSADVALLTEIRDLLAQQNGSKSN
ncbi:large conductance mechanosensitive channel protein MscL [Jonesiaceae bacterium BS-20]|uniref:Large-conductance mechanosensitive channel n=1 Tax=Jonesiaceae bacterium BS-20 TaxID=3120821 RepID=A0AAU7DX17_9MICO